MYAIVTFKEEESVLEVLNRNHFFNKHQISIDRMLKKKIPEKPTSFILSNELFVGGIPTDASKGEFKRRNRILVYEIWKNKKAHSSI